MQAFRELGKRLTKGVVQRALLKAVRPVEEDAKTRVRVRRGNVKRRIAVSTKLSRRQKRAAKASGKGKPLVEIYVGAAPARHAHLLEFGTGPRRHKKSGKSTGSMPPFPFMRPAWDGNKDRVLATFGKEMWIEIEKAAKRLARRNAKGTRRK